jgi:hypothetical protein
VIGAWTAADVVTIIGSLTASIVLVIQTFRNGKTLKAVHTVATAIDASVNGVPPGTRTIRQGVDQLVASDDATAAGSTPTLRQLLEQTLAKMEANNGS